MITSHKFKSWESCVGWRGPGSRQRTAPRAGQKNDNQASAYNIGLYLAAADVSIPRGFSTTKNYLSIFRETNCHDLIVAICNHEK